jgi:hypothetical protein
MQQFTLNNWLEWYYDDELYGRQDLKNFKKYTNRYRCAVKEVGSYVEELYKTASSTLEHFNGKDLTLCFSGGVDSEMVLRAYLGIGHPLNVVIYRYENNLNEHDVRNAVAVCEQLNSPYKIIDFNIQHFFENDAADMIEICQIDKPLQLVGCKFLEITDGVSIMGEGDLFVNMRPVYDANDKLNYYWAMSEPSTEIARELYMMHLGKSAIPKWLQWRPELLLIALESDYTKKLTNKEYSNVYVSLENKHELYSQYFSDIIKRPKYSGFEKIENAPWLIEFKKEIIKRNGDMLKHMQPYDRTIKQSINELRGVSINSRK